MVNPAQYFLEDASEEENQLSRHIWTHSPMFFELRCIIPGCEKAKTCFATKGTLVHHKMSKHEQPYERAARDVVKYYYDDGFTKHYCGSFKFTYNAYHYSEEKFYMKQAYDKILEDHPYAERDHKMRLEVLAAKKVANEPKKVFDPVELTRNIQAGTSM